MRDSSDRTYVAVVDGAHRFQASRSASDARAVGRDFEYTLSFHPEAGVVHRAGGERAGVGDYWLSVVVTEPGAAGAEVFVGSPGQP